MKNIFTHNFNDTLGPSISLFQVSVCRDLMLSIRRKKKCSLFPLTSPNKLGTVGRHNFFFLLTFFYLFSKKVTHFYIANMFIFVIFTLTG